MRKYPHLPVWQEKHILHLAELKNNNKKKRSKKCSTCNKVFEYWPSVRPDAKYCSRKCQNSSVKMRRLSSERGRRNKGRLSGKKNPNWKGGIYPLYETIRKMIEMKVWRDKVYRRDNYTCQICMDNKGGNLNAHHIIPFYKIIKNFKSIEEARNCKLLWNINNGITLCRECHKKVEV